jgi:hypothetical protein
VIGGTPMGCIVIIMTVSRFAVQSPLSCRVAAVIKLSGLCWAGAAGTVGMLVGVAIVFGKLLVLPPRTHHMTPVQTKHPRAAVTAFLDIVFTFGGQVSRVHTLLRRSVLSGLDMACTNLWENKNRRASALWPCTHLTGCRRDMLRWHSSAPAVQMMQKGGSLTLR